MRSLVLGSVFCSGPTSLFLVKLSEKKLYYPTCNDDDDVDDVLHLCRFLPVKSLNSCSL